MIAYGLTVILLPLLVKPFFMAIAIVTLIAAGIAGRIASKITCRLVVTRLSSTLRQRLNRALRPLLCSVNLRILVVTRPEVAESLRFLIRELDHETPSRPYRAVLSLAVAPTLFAALAASSCVAVLAMSHPGAPWAPPLLSLAADATGYVGAGVFVATLAVFAIPLPVREHTRVAVCPQGSEQARTALRHRHPDPREHLSSNGLIYTRGVWYIRRGREQ